MKTHFFFSIAPTIVISDSESEGHSLVDSAVVVPKSTCVNKGKKVDRSSTFQEPTPVAEYKQMQHLFKKPFVPTSRPQSSGTSGPSSRPQSSGTSGPSSHQQSSGISDPSSSNETVTRPAHFLPISISSVLAKLPAPRARPLPVDDEIEDFLQRGKYITTLFIPYIPQA